MDPLTTLYDLKYTRAKDDLLQRVRKFEGRRGEAYPVKSAIEEAQLTQRNWLELRAGVTLSALEALATQMGGLREGRKSILFFSQGPPLPPSSPNEQRYREAMEAANRGNVTIHVIDPRPLGSVGFGGANTLRRIAADTGGRAIVNTNDPTEQLNGVMADASAYYLIGYTPTRRGNDGKFHEIKVRVKRRGVRVTARRGYWSASEKEMTAAAEAAATPVNVGLTTALGALSDSVNTRAVAIWTGFAKGEGDRTRVTFTWEANPGSTDKPARLEIQPVDDTGKETMPAQVIGGAPGELPLMAHFQMAPGRQRIRFTSMTAAGDIIDRWVQAQPIPDLTKQTLVLVHTAIPARAKHDRVPRHRKQPSRIADRLDALWPPPIACWSSSKCRRRRRDAANQGGVAECEGRRAARPRRATADRRQTPDAPAGRQSCQQHLRAQGRGDPSAISPRSSGWPSASPVRPPIDAD